MQYWWTWPLCVFRLCVCLRVSCAISSCHMNSADEARSAVCPLGQAFYVTRLASSCVSHRVCICVNVCLLVSVGIFVRVQVWEPASFTYVWNSKTLYSWSRIARNRDKACTNKKETLCKSQNTLITFSFLRACHLLHFGICSVFPFCVCFVMCVLSLVATVDFCHWKPRNMTVK